MKAPFPAPVENWHNDTYPTINPTRPELSVKGKKVIVTGGGSGIGRGVVEAFALAGASSIAITGRREELLLDTKKSIESKYDVQITIFAVDVTDAAMMKKAAAEIGTWDVLIMNAGYLSTRDFSLNVGLEEWWKPFETNVKGAYITVDAFLPTKGKDAVIVGTSSAVITLPAGMTPTLSSYVASKLGLTKFLEVLAVEYPEVRIMIVHPGVIETEIYRKSGVEGKFPVDTLELASHFMVWAASEEAAFLRGRMIACNWDVDELKAKAKEIEGSFLFQSTIQGFLAPLPF